MDSGNSGSVQSSSGGDEEYDSRADSISSLFTAMSNQPLPPQPPPRQHHHLSSAATVFDSMLQNYHLDPISQLPAVLPNPNSLPNLDTAWPHRPEPNRIIQSQQPIFGSQAQPQGPFTSSPSPTVPFPPVTVNSTHVARNPKKRSRASRRAPTTVLTTDTTNFRAMVQEFTGIPAPPFTSSSPFPRGRLDLFGAPSSTRSNPLDSSQRQPPYLLRPYAQKVQPPPPPFLSSSSSSSSLLLDSSLSNTDNFTSGLASNSSYDQLGLYRPPFQSLLQSPPRYPQPNSSIFGLKKQESLEIQSNDSNIKMGVFEDFGLSHTHLSGPPNLVSPEGTTWRADSFLASLIRVGSSNGDIEQDHLRPANGDFDFSRNFREEKGQNNNSARGQGMVEPWVCSSD